MTTVPSNARILTGPELIEAYCADMEWRELRPTTVANRRSYLRKYENEVGILAADEFSVQRWLNRPSLQPQTRAMWLITIHGLYVFLNKRGFVERVPDHRGNLVDFDPTADIIKPKSRKGKPHPISVEDLDRALGIADRLMTCWLLIGARQGARCQEIALMSREDIHEDDEEPWLRIEHGKGNKSRDLPLHPDVWIALEALPVSESGRLWYLTPQQMSRTINDFLHLEVQTKSTAHALRHRFGTDAYRASLDLQLVADLMGHSNTAVTSVYAAADHRKAAGVIASLGRKIEDEVIEAVAA